VFNLGFQQTTHFAVGAHASFSSLYDYKEKFNVIR
jgi:hypothetical protein